MEAEKVPNITMPELTAMERPELEGAYVFWRELHRKAELYSDESKHADVQMQRLLAAMRGRLA